MTTRQINFPVKFENFEKIINGKLWYIELPVKKGGQCEILKVDKGTTLQKHVHKKSDFQILIIKGRGLAIEGKRCSYYHQGMGFTIPKGMEHSFIALEETIMYSESLGHSEGDTEFITENYPLYAMYTNPHFQALLDLKTARKLYKDKQKNNNIVGDLVIDFLGALPREINEADKELITRL